MADDAEIEARLLRLERAVFGDGNGGIDPPDDDPDAPKGSGTPVGLTRRVAEMEGLKGTLLELLRTIREKLVGKKEPVGV